MSFGRKIIKQRRNIIALNDLVVCLAAEDIKRKRNKENGRRLARLVAGCLTQFSEQIQNLTPKTKNFDLWLNNKLKQDDHV